MDKASIDLKKNGNMRVPSLTTRSQAKALCAIETGRHTQVTLNRAKKTALVFISGLTDHFMKVGTLKTKKKAMESSKAQTIKYFKVTGRMASEKVRGFSLLGENCILEFGQMISLLLKLLFDNQFMFC